MNNPVLYERNEAQRALVKNEITWASWFRNNNWHALEADLRGAILNEALRELFAQQGSEGLQPFVRFTMANDQVSFDNDIEAALVCDLLNPEDPHGVILLSACAQRYDDWQREPVNRQQACDKV